jgi:hypothetical protein
MAHRYLAQKVIFSWTLAMLCIFVVSVHAFADDDKWLIARNSSNGACNVQLASSRPILGQELKKYDSRKDACKAAKDLKTDDPSATKLCYDYTKGTREDCKKEKQELPK